MKFFLIFATVFIAISIYIHRRFIKKLDLRDKIKKYLNIFLIFNLLSVFGYIIARHHLLVPNWLYFVLSLSIGIIFLMFITALIFDLINISINRVIYSQERRLFFKKSLDLVALFALFGVTFKGIDEARSLVVERVDVKIDNLNYKYSIVQLSDIHIGGLIDKEFIKNLTIKVNELKPDLVVITGDMIDIDIKSATPILAELKNLKSKYGTYFVVGNHEYFHNIEDILKAVKNIGIKILENESTYIGDKNNGFNLLGVYDVIGNRKGYYKPDIKKAISNIHKNRPNILLVHQPRFIETIPENIRIDLMLSGHTHGGQIYPFRFLVKLKQPYIEGLYRDNLNRQIYVNRGTGFWGPPMRLGSKPEISYITIS